MSFTINKQLIFIDRFQFQNSPLDILVKNLSQEAFKYFISQAFDNNVLDLVKQKEFQPSGYVSDFKNFKEELRSKEKFYSSLKYKKIIDKNMNIFLMLCFE